MAIFKNRTWEIGNMRLFVNCEPQFFCILENLMFFKHDFYANSKYTTIFEIRQKLTQKIVILFYES